MLIKSVTVMSTSIIINAMKHAQNTPSNTLPIMFSFMMLFSVANTAKQKHMQPSGCNVNIHE